MLPERGIQLADSSTRLFDARITLSEASSVVGKTVEEATKAVGDGMKIIRIRRDDLSLYAGRNEVLRAGDRLRVRDTSTHLANFARAMKGTLQRRDSAGSDETPEGLAMAEVAVVGGSSLDRANLKSSSFLRDYELAVLALHRRGKDVWQPHEEIQDVVLVQGDVMLVQGPRNQIRRLKRNGEFLVLDATMELPRTRKAKLALAILTAVIVLAATGVMHIAVSAVFGALLMLATRCLRIGVAIRAISPAVFFVVAASLALGDALVKTGATQYLTDVFLFLTAGATPTVILAALMMLLALLTNVRLQQRGRRHRHTHRYRHRRPAKPAPGTVRARGPLRRQHELCDANGLQDQPPRDERRRLPLQRVRPRRHPAHVPDVGRAHLSSGINVLLTTDESCASTASSHRTSPLRDEVRQAASVPARSRRPPPRNGEERRVG